MSSLDNMNCPRGMILGASISCALATALASAFLFGSSIPNRTQPHTGLTSEQLPLETSPDPVELGVVGGVEPLERSVSVTNARSDPLTLVRVESSCPCVSASGLPVRIGLGQSAVLTIRFDPSADPGFEGALSVDLAGFLTNGEIAFRTQARLRAEYEQ